MERSWKNRENLNKNEIAKLEKDGLEILNELDRLKEVPYDQMDPTDLERLKWAGVYAQRPKNGLFLVRAKLPAGMITTGQARAMAGVARDFSKGVVQITNRQCMQMHDIRLSDVPDIIGRLNAVGLTTIGGCGDTVRNILGNPLMGVDPEELFDTTPVVMAMHDQMVGNPAYSNLPRKFKISVSANPHDQGFAGINDLAFVPARYEAADGADLGFHVYVGGGLSTQPLLAQKLPFFVSPDQALPLAQAVAVIFRERGYRENRRHCRLKFLVEDLGVDKMAQLIEDQTGPLRRGGVEIEKDWERGTFYGIHAQKDPALVYAGFLVPTGDIAADDLDAFCDLAESVGSHDLRTTNSRNLIIINVPAHQADKLAQSQVAGRFPLAADAFTGYCASCPGNDYCSYAPIETKQRLVAITQALHQAFPDLDTPLRINLSGCVHSCGHPQIAGIGLVGGRVKVDGVSKDTFSVYVGGSLGKEAKLGAQLKGRVDEDHIIPLCKAFVQYYLDNRAPGEIFYDFVRRVGSDTFQKILDGFALR